MKTRIVHTKLWDDTYFSELNTTEKLFFIYLITNESVNISGAYELQSRRISFDTGIGVKEIEKIKIKFQQDERFIFIDSWIKIINVDKYNNYRFSEKNEKAYNRELELIPSYVRQIFNLSFTLEDYEKKNYIKKGNTYEHRLIAEKLLKRKLAENEVVHHLDKNPENNNPLNLAVMDKTKHQQYHLGEIDLSDTNMILVSENLILGINHKSEIINHKSEIKEDKSLREGDFQEIADSYNVPVSFVMSKWEDLQNWSKAKGKTYKDYNAALRNWVKRDAVQIKKEQHDRSKIVYVGEALN